MSMPTRDFWIGFITGTVVGAVGYRLYEQNNGQLQRLVQVRPLEARGLTTGDQSSIPSVIETTANVIKKGIENATDATQMVLEKSGDSTQSAVDSASKVVKELIGHMEESRKNKTK
jgi:gas vesicle protein